MMKKPVNKITSLFTDTKAPYFLAATLIFGISIGIFNGVLNNYLFEILNIGKAERGIIEFPREFPGLMLIIIVALLYRICEIQILRLSFLISLAGIIGIVFLGEYRITAISMIVLWSTGEHIMMPLRQSLAVHMAQKGKEGVALGTVRSMTNTGKLVGFYLIPLVFALLSFNSIRLEPFSRFRLAFILAAAFLMLGFLVSLKLRKSDQHIKRKRLLFRKKFSKYYILEMFFGGRKQVFLTFAPYVLIVNYGIQTEMLALLYGILSTISIFTGPVVGKIVDRLGYRIVIIVDTVLLILLCLLYGFTHRFFPREIAFLVVCCVFVLDAVLFTVGIARTMYVRSIAENKDEITSTLSTGLSINHLISIVIAVAGGVLWAKLGLEVLFSIAALFGLGSFLFSLTLPREKRAL